MRKSMLFIYLIALCGSLFGQNESKWRGVGLGAGATISNHTRNAGSSTIKSTKPSFYAEITTGHNFNSRFSFDAGLSYVSTAEWKQKRDYLMIPVDFNAKIIAGLHASAGLYAAYNVNWNAGKNILGSLPPGVESPNLDLNPNNQKYNKASAGLRFRVFYEYQFAKFFVGYTLGLTNISHYPSKYSEYSRIFNVGVNFKILK